MSRIHVKQSTHTEGRQPRFYAEVGDIVSVRTSNGKGLIAATLEAINGQQVTVRHLHDDTIQDLPAAEVVGVMDT